MRAVVLVCLLHAASATPFSWYEPTDPGFFPVQSDCDRDYSSCGCCVMTKEVNRLDMYFNKTLTELQNNYTEAIECLNAVETTRVAFTASLYNDLEFRCDESANSVIVYQKVHFNLGNAYNESSGVFTVPRSGVYALAVTVYVDGGAKDSMVYLCASLMVNSTVLVSAHDYTHEDQEDSSNILVLTHLKAGDMVTVYLNTGCSICDQNHYNTFSGFLIYSTE